MCPKTAETRNTTVSLDPDTTLVEETADEWIGDDNNNETRRCAPLLYLSNTRALVIHGSTISRDKAREVSLAYVNRP